ncbi:MAG TPA: hypothetical protein VG411_18335 [Actinomycetota bacterium]|nr:hypothetical protein [Actinomycetota bacterium]
MWGGSSLPHGPPRAPAPTSLLRVRFAELLTHSYPLERVAEPLAQAAGLADPDDRLLKAVIRP